MTTSMLHIVKRVKKKSAGVDGFFVGVVASHTMTTFDREAFRSRLRKYREAAGLSQWEVYEATGIRPTTIAQYETGRSVPPIWNLLKLAETLGFSIDVLCGLKKR